MLAHVENALKELQQQKKRPGVIAAGLTKTLDQAEAAIAELRDATQANAAAILQLAMDANQDPRDTLPEVVAIVDRVRVFRLEQ